MNEIREEERDREDEELMDALEDIRRKEAFEAAFLALGELPLADRIKLQEDTTPYGAWLMGYAEALMKEDK